MEKIVDADMGSRTIVFKVEPEPEEEQYMEEVVVMDALQDVEVEIEVSDSTDAFAEADNSDVVNENADDSSQPEHFLSALTHLSEVATIYGRSRGLDKRSYRYIDLIVMAIQSKPENKATVRDIYKFIETNVPYFEGKEKPVWQNTIRHTLSHYECFVKLPKEGLGHFWTLRDGYENHIHPNSKNPYRGSGNSQERLNTSDNRPYKGKSSKNIEINTERTTTTLERPPYSYAELIAMAINSTSDRRATLNEIYTYIIQTFPYYEYREKRGWQNSIRHTLSLNGCFVKDPQRHLRNYWTIGDSRRFQVLEAQVESIGNYQSTFKEEVVEEECQLEIDTENVATLDHSYTTLVTSDGADSASETETKLYTSSDIPTSSEISMNADEQELGDSSRSLVCEYCPKSFSSVAKFKQHTLVHPGKYRYACEICQKTYKSIGTLVRHNRIHHEQPQRTTMYRCQECFEIFAHLSHLETHMLSHSDP